MEKSAAKGSYWAYVLDEQSRAKLLERFPPKFSDVIAHHVTVAFGRTIPAGFHAGEKADMQVIWYAADESLECVVVRAAGSFHRPDGKPYHVTLSLDRDAGRKPVHSNDVIATIGNMRAVVPVVGLTGVLTFC